jgi:tousled-like kinase
MKDRYQLLNMLGRGGFSEVYRAFDLETNSYCAVKIHALAPDMSEVHRKNYIRRAMREYEIQKGLKHHKVVTLMDSFPINTLSFGTVLELCDGDTLFEYMLRYGSLPEKEARGIIIQVLSGLKYLNSNETGNRIIHYDLKPGNVFFQCGEVKIADFGLSKIVHQSNAGESIDLTSQGAGTYWYLPPECMVLEANPSEAPKISNKVDVWSTGVIFYELLFGKRPFGHGQSQEALRRAAMAGQAFDNSVQLPVTPKVSNECARFLKRLLAQNKDERPDVIEAFNDVYIRGSTRKAKLKEDSVDSGGPTAAVVAQEPEGG